MKTAIARRIKTLKVEGGIKSADLAELLNTTPETVSRWNRGHTSPRGAAERTILELEYIIERLREFYTDPEDARLWLFSPQKLLGGRKPADLIEAGQIEEVLTLINELSDVVYS